MGAVRASPLFRQVMTVSLPSKGSSAPSYTDRNESWRFRTPQLAGVRSTPAGFVPGATYS